MMSTSMRLMFLLLIGFCAIVCRTVSAWHGAVGVNDRYPFAENTPAGSVVGGIPLTYGGGPRANGGGNWPAADCAALALDLHGRVTNHADLNTASRMYGVMVIDIDTVGVQQRHIHIARSGYNADGSAPANAMTGIATAIQNANGGTVGTFVEYNINLITSQDKNQLCYWARSTHGRATPFTAAPQTCQPHVEPNPDWEYIWTVANTDVARKIQYRHVAGVNAYTFTEEISNPIGTCAGTKLALSKPATGTIRCMAERYFTNVANTVTVNHFTIPGNLADQNYANGDLTPSCSTCQSIIPNILSGTISGWIAGHALPGDGSGNCKGTSVAEWPLGAYAGPPPTPSQAVRRQQAQAALELAQASRAVNGFIGQPNNQCARPVVLPPPVVPLVRSRSADNLKKVAQPLLVRRGSGGLRHHENELEPMNE